MTHAGPDGRRGGRATLTAIVVVVVAFLVLMGWAHDFITLDGSKTVYTVKCVGGQWNGPDCSGSLQAAERYRFRALKAHSEVIFWVAGSAEPSGKLAPCAIANAKEWVCKPGPDSGRTITHEMKFGHPVPEPHGPAKPFHQVAKWKWLLLNKGVGVFRSADA
ncbi:hypothetical protein ACFPOE_16030 [Caenimonas terrae]|uniref:Uncharacterized protein n=1 Tax=Caenimonas terrae TaxID=696074 RepID=A0ABW0NIB9_9BURK